MTPAGEFLDYSDEKWENGSRMEFILHSGPQEGEDPSDQLEIIITDQDGKVRNWLMNIEDAITLIRGLSRLVDNALATNKPISPNYEVKR